MTRPEIAGLRICDAQIHVPDLPHTVHVDGIEEDDVLREMDSAGVANLIIVPLAAPGDDVSIYNEVSLKIAEGRPDRFRVMGRFDLTRPANASKLANWKSNPMMVGSRVSFIRDPNETLLKNDEIEWFWDAAEEAGVAVACLVANNLVAKLGEIAQRHPKLKLTVDHFGFTPYAVYDDPVEAVRPILDIAHLPNVSVKASALPEGVADDFPFNSLHEAIRLVVEAYTPHRVFWGSDLTRLKCPYIEWVKTFTEELSFLSDDDIRLIMGDAVRAWVGWS